MCGVQDIIEPVNIKIDGIKRESTDVRKEKSRDAARHRRAKEGDYFQELEQLIPVHGTPPHSQMSSIDKTSLIRLTVSYLKTRDIIQHADINIPDIKEECGVGNLDLLSAINGFGIVLNEYQDIVYVTNNVSEYIGLTSFELLGMSLTEFVHPCDHTIINNMMNKQLHNQVKASIRIKCTITDRGRFINLKQANYKALKLEGKLVELPERSEGGVHGRLFIGVASLVSDGLTTGGQASGVFQTKHSPDFKFIESDSWLVEEGGYSADFLLGQSLFRFIHAEDVAKLSASLSKLAENVNCESEVYRLLVAGGGYVYIQTTATYVTSRKGSAKGTTILLKHSLLTEVIDAGQIMDVIQMEAAKCEARPILSAVRRVTNQKSRDDEAENIVGNNHTITPTTQEQVKLKEESDVLVDLVKDQDGYSDLLAILPAPSHQQTSDIHQVTSNEQSVMADTDTLSLLSNRSSVIVSTKANNKKPNTSAAFSYVCTPVTESLFCDDSDVTESLFCDQQSDPDDNSNTQPETAASQLITEQLFDSAATAAPIMLSPVTEMLLSDEENSITSNSQNSQGDDDTQVVTTLDFDNDVYPMKNIFGSMMIEDIEKLSPFINQEECISLNKMGSLDDMFEPLSLETFDDFDLEDAFTINANTESLFVQEEDEIFEEQSNDKNIMFLNSDKDYESVSASGCLLSSWSDSATPTSPKFTDVLPGIMYPSPEEPAMSLPQEEKNGGHILKVSTHSTPPPVYTTNDLLVPAKTPPIVNDRPSVNAGGYNNPIFKEIDFVPQIPDPLAANVGLSPTPTSRTKKLGGEVLDMDYLKEKVDIALFGSHHQQLKYQQSGHEGGVIVGVPRYVIVPARQENHGASSSQSPRPTITLSEQSYQNTSHNKTYIKSIPKASVLEPGGSVATPCQNTGNNVTSPDMMKSVYEETGCNVTAHIRRNSVLRNMMMDPIRTRGEKRTISHTTSQQTNKQIKLDIQKQTRKQITLEQGCSQVTNEGNMAGGTVRSHHQTELPQHGTALSQWSTMLPDGSFSLPLSPDYAAALFDF